jgi:hypothetical protein
MKKLICIGILLLAFAQAGLAQYVYSGFTSGVSQVVAATAGVGAGTYYADQTETFSGGTAGATTCYTTDGATPGATAAGTCDSDGHTLTYSTGFAVQSTTTVQWLGTKSGMTNSAVQSATLTLTSNIALVQYVYCQQASTSGAYNCTPDSNATSTSSTSLTPADGSTTFTTQPDLFVVTGFNDKFNTLARPSAPAAF